MCTQFSFKYEIYIHVIVHYHDFYVYIQMYLQYNKQLKDNLDIDRARLVLLGRIP